MKKLIFVLPLLLLITSCALNKPVCVERTPLLIQPPAAVKLQTPNWIIVTEDNYQQIFKQLKDGGNLPVVYALTGKDLQDNIIDLGKIKQYIDQQNIIIASYQQYYSKDKK